MPQPHNHIRHSHIKGDAKVTPVWHQRYLTQVFKLLYIHLLYAQKGIQGGTKVT